MFVLVQMHADTLLYIEDSHCQMRLACALDPTQFTCACRVVDSDTNLQLFGLPTVYIRPAVAHLLFLLQASCRSSPLLYALCGVYPVLWPPQLLYTRQSCNREPCVIGTQLES